MTKPRFAIEMDVEELWSLVCNPPIVSDAIRRQCVKILRPLTGGVDRHGRRLPERPVPTPRRRARR